VTEPTASVIVVTRRRPVQLAHCLAVLRALSPPPHEIVVVDNSKGDRDSEAAARAAGARYVVEPRGGASVARNTGAIAATGDLIAYTDDDAEPDGDWLARHVEAFRDPGGGGSAGRVLPFGTDDFPASSTHEGDMGTEPFRLDQATPRWFERANFGEIGIGPNMVFRRSLLDRGWRFDEALGVGAAIPGGEEHRAFADAIAHGYAVVYVPDAIVRHGTVLTPAEAVRRRRRMLRASVGYAFLLAAESPEARRAVMRFYGSALGNGGRPRAAGGRRNSTYESPDWVGLTGALALTPWMCLRAWLMRRR